MPVNLTELTVCWSYDLFFRLRGSHVHIHINEWMIVRRAAESKGAGTNNRGEDSTGHASKL